MKSHHTKRKKLCPYHLLFPLGFLGGFMLLWLFRTKIPSSTLAQFSMLFEKRNMNCRAFPMFYSCLILHFHSFLLVLFFAITNVWAIYRGFLFFKVGFFQGLLCGICIFSQKWIGLAAYLFLGFPQNLLLIPLYLILIQNIDYYRENERGTHSLLSHFPFFLGCGVLVLLACCMESSLNPLILNLFKGFC